MGSAIWSLVIAIHTFLVLMGGGRRCRKWMLGKIRVSMSVLGLCVWLFVGFIGIVGIVLIEKIHPEKGPFCKSVVVIQLIN